jgi:DHA3 family macrolide efflux protein-like MFS transporter
MFFISPFGGVWADKYNKKHLINIADACIAVVTLIMAIVFTLGYQEMWLLLICSGIRSLGQGVQMPAASALVPELVPEENLTKINGLNSSIQSMALLVSPMIAGMLLSYMPITSILYIDVVTAIVGIVILYSFVKSIHVDKKKTEESYFSELKEGISYIKKQDFIKKLITMSALFNIMIAPTAILTPLQVTRDFGGGVTKLTIVETIFFVGTMLGGIIIGIWGGFKKNKSYTLAFATMSSAVMIIFLGIFENFWLYVAAMGLGGALFALFNPPLMTILQSQVNKDYMGRVFSILTMVSTVSMPLGTIIWGPLSDKVSIDTLLIISGTLIFVIGSFFIFDKTMLRIGAAKKIEK